MDDEFEYNDVKTLKDIINYEFENSIFSFNNDDDWHEIITSYKGNGQYNDNNNRRILSGLPIEAGERLGEHDHKESEIELFGHLYRLKGISKCGQNNASPRFCVGIHLGQAIKLPKGLSLPMTKMCNFMYIAKICLGFDPNLMELKLSIQFQSIHKWKRIAKKLLNVVKHLPYKVTRYMKWASKASTNAAAYNNMNDNIYNNYYNELFENDNNEISSEFVDEWYDENDDRQWVVSSSQINNGNDIYWNDNEIWDDDMDSVGDMGGDKVGSAVIKTDKGREMERRCMHMMGGRLCLCQFLQWIDSPQYHCQPKENIMFNPNKISQVKGDGNNNKISGAVDIDINDYININYYDDSDDGDDDGYDDVYGYSANTDMSHYYNEIGPQINDGYAAGIQGEYDDILDEDYYESMDIDDVIYGDLDGEESVYIDNDNYNGGDNAQEEYINEYNAQQEQDDYYQDDMDNMDENYVNEEENDYYENDEMDNDEEYIDAMDDYYENENEEENDYYENDEMDNYYEDENENEEDDDMDEEYEYDEMDN
eukprot:216565_1